MSQARCNRSSPTVKRILKEAQELRTAADPSLYAAPLESDIFEWHFTIRGPPSTPYEKGFYHGRIVLPPTYPLRPPSFRFLTPSGRFETNREICLSISGHHEETWQPAWGIRTALSALRAFMEADAKGQVGGLEMSKTERERLANASASWSCAICGGQTNQTILVDNQPLSDAEPHQETGKLPAIIAPLEFRTKVIDASPISEHTAKTTESFAHFTAASTKPKEEKAASNSITSPTNPSSERQSETFPWWLDRAICGVLLALILMVAKRLY